MGNSRCLQFNSTVTWPNCLTLYSTEAPLLTYSFIAETEGSVRLFFPNPFQGHYDRWFKRNYPSMSVQSVTSFNTYLTSRSVTDFSV